MISSELSYIKSLLLSALQQQEDHRESFILNHPAATPLQKQEVLDLLNAHTQAPSLLNQSILDQLPFPGQAFSHIFCAPGDRIADRYRIEKALSNTPNSQVYLASDLRLADNQVVVKIIPPQASHTKDLYDLLWREISALARLQHPGVAGLIDTGVLPGNFSFLVLQYCPGYTLDDWLLMAKPNFEQRCHIFRQLLNTTTAIHAAGLLHLDLKPRNIIINNQHNGVPAAVILDFGISRVNNTQDTDPADTSGTPSFSAPERSDGIASAASDIYSLGRIAQILFPAPGRRLRSLIQDALGEHPVHRPPSAAVFLQRFESSLPGTGRLLQHAGLAFIPLLAALAWVLIPNSDPFPAPHFRQLTSLRGIESDPAFSPDGKTVFFTHGPGQLQPASIYTVPFAGGQPEIFLTAPPNQRFGSAAVSPDDQTVALVLDRGLLPSQIQTTARDGSNLKTVFTGRAERIAFGSQPHLLYFSVRTPDEGTTSLRLLNLRSGELTTLPPPPQGYRGDIDVAVSPDGRTLAFTRYRIQESGDLYITSLNAAGLPIGAPRRLTTLDRRVRYPHWLADNKTILLNAGSLTASESWAIRFKGDPLGSSFTVQPLPGWGTQHNRLAASTSLNHIAAVEESEDCDIYKLSLHPDKPKVLERWLSSTSLDEEPRFSPDGKQIAFYSERNGSLQGWLADNDSNPAPRQITSFEKAEKAWPAWSAPRSAFYFARIPALGPELQQVQLGEEHSLARRIFSAPISQQIAGLSVDGLAVLARSGDDAAPRLERWSLLSNNKEFLAAVPARYAREFYRQGNSGERIILYVEPHEGNGLFLLERGKVRQLYPSLKPRNTFAYHDGFAYVASQTPSPGIYRINIDSGKSSLVHPLDKNAGWGMDVSPDGSELLIALYDFENSDIVAATWPDTNPDLYQRLRTALRAWLP